MLLLLIEEYLDNQKIKGKLSKNTELSYRRDLKKMAEYLESCGIREAHRVTATALNSYILYLEKQGASASSIARYIASMKSFYYYLFKRHRIGEDPAEELQAPKAEHNGTSPLTKEELNLLLAPPKDGGAKEQRDHVMVVLMCSVGLKASELILLKPEDLNTKLGYLTCRRDNARRTVSFDGQTGQLLEHYLESVRPYFIKESQDAPLFPNCRGGWMSRQGLWKLVREYGERCGAGREVTPQRLCVGER